MKIYTRTGDDGTTGLFSGERVSKTHGRVAAYGAVDELNSMLGLVRASGAQQEVIALTVEVQRQLFKLGADLATSEGSREVVRIGREETGWLEAEIDRLTAGLPALTHFILPGGSLAAAQIHVARAISRRCEREVLSVDGVRAEVVVYLNRLSDFLFTLARYENRLAGGSEIEWRA